MNCRRAASPPGMDVTALPSSRLTGLGRGSCQDNVTAWTSWTRWPEDVADIIANSIPKDGSVPSLRTIKKMLLARGVKTSKYSIANILDKLGYARPKA